MTDLGLLKNFLGLEIDQYDASIKVRKLKYDVDLLLNFKMDECKEEKCPFLSGVKLGDFGSSLLLDNSLYRKLVRSFIYLTQPQPDLYYEVGVVARYMQEPHEIHWNAGKRILLLIFHMLS